MEIKFSIESDVLHLFFYGELDEHSAKMSRDKLDILIESKKFSKVVFEFSELNFTDSTGIGLLIGRYKKLKTKNIPCYIRKPKPQIEKVLSMTGIFQIMPKIS